MSYCCIDCFGAIEIVEFSLSRLSASLPVEVCSSLIRIKSLTPSAVEIVAKVVVVVVVVSSDVVVVILFVLHASRVTLRDHLQLHTVFHS